MAELVGTWCADTSTITVMDMNVPGELMLRESMQGRFAAGFLKVSADTWWEADVFYTQDDDDSVCSDEMFCGDASENAPQPAAAARLRIRLDRSVASESVLSVARLNLCPAVPAHDWASAAVTQFLKRSQVVTDSVEIPTVSSVHEPALGSVTPIMERREIEGIWHRDSGRFSIVYITGSENLIYREALEGGHYIGGDVRPPPPGTDWWMADLFYTRCVDEVEDYEEDLNYLDLDEDDVVVGSGSVEPEFFGRSRLRLSTIGPDGVPLLESQLSKTELLDVDWGSIAVTDARRQKPVK